MRHRRVSMRCVGKKKSSPKKNNLYFQTRKMRQKCLESLVFELEKCESTQNDRLNELYNFAFMKELRKLWLEGDIGQKLMPGLKNVCNCKKKFTRKAVDLGQFLSYRKVKVCVGKKILRALTLYKMIDLIGRAV